jgi:hypothetical protein
MSKKLSKKSLVILLLSYHLNPVKIGKERYNIIQKNNYLILSYKL